MEKHVLFERMILVYSWVYGKHNAPLFHIDYIQKPGRVESLCICFFSLLSHNTTIESILYITAQETQYTHVEHAGVHYFPISKRFTFVSFDRIGTVNKRKDENL